MSTNPGLGGVSTPLRNLLTDCHNKVIIYPTPSQGTSTENTRGAYRTRPEYTR